ncbi:MAG: class I SAM-dependent methyltransferase [Nitrospirota bacterium]
MQVEYVIFRKRSDRSYYIAERFGKYLRGDILDIGCDRAILRSILNGVDYTGIDIDGIPDIRIDLDSIDRLPFEDNRFTCSICADVLEHLDNLHFIFSEIVRITRGNIIISLPNNWVNIRKPLQKGVGSIAHYGLPPERSGDRHKWFFSLLEAVDFLKQQEKRYPISIEEIVVNEKPRSIITTMSRRLIYLSKERYLNRYAHTVWVVFKKDVSD